MNSGTEPITKMAASIKTRRWAERAPLRVGTILSLQPARPSSERLEEMGWPIDAGGLAEELVRLRDRDGGPELYVTENGACCDDTPAADGNRP